MCVERGGGDWGRDGEKEGRREQTGGRGGEQSMCI